MNILCRAMAITPNDPVLPDDAGSVTWWLRPNVEPITHRSVLEECSPRALRPRTLPADGLPVATERVVRGARLNPEELPADLSGWLDRQMIADLSVVAALTLDTPPSGKGDPPPRESDWNSPQFLVLLTYCYAVGLYDSQSIEARMQDSGRFRALFGEEYPDWHRLRRFRRTNRVVLQHCLEGVFRSVFWYHQRILEHRAAGVRGEEACSCALPDQSLELRLNLAREAERRIRWAACLDSIALDE